MSLVYEIVKSFMICLLGVDAVGGYPPPILFLSEAEFETSVAGCPPQDHGSHSLQMPLGGHLFHMPPLGNPWTMYIRWELSGQLVLDAGFELTVNLYSSCIQPSP